MLRLSNLDPRIVKQIWKGIQHNYAETPPATSTQGAAIKSTTTDQPQQATPQADKAASSSAAPAAKPTAAPPSPETASRVTAQRMVAAS